MSGITKCLWMALREGKEEAVRYLMNCLGDSKLPGLEGYALLVEANEKRYTEIGKLVAGAIEVGSRSEGKHTEGTGEEGKREDSALLLSTLLVLTAVNCESLETVEILLDRNPSVSETLLMAAIHNDRTDIAEMLMNRGLDPNIPSKVGITPLQFAIQVNKIQLKESLSKRGLEVNIVSSEGSSRPNERDEMTKGFLRIVKRLLGSKSSLTCRLGKSGFIDYNRCTDYVPLHAAIRKGNPRMVKLLLSRGGDVRATNKDNETAFQVALGERHAFPKEEDRAVILAYVVLSHLDNEMRNRAAILNAVESTRSFYANILSDFATRKTYITRMIFEIMYHRRASDCELLMALVIHSATERGYRQLVASLFQSASSDLKLLYESVSIDGFSLLHSAANSHQTGMIKLLLEYGANVNAKDAFGKTAIYYAIENGDLRTTLGLLFFGADISNSPHLLNTAVRKANKEIVCVLLRYAESGCVDVNAKDETGSSALHYTTLRNNKKMGVNDKTPIPYDHDSVVSVRRKVDIARLLIGRGAIVDARNDRGETALHAAAKRGYPEVTELLLEHGADVAAIDKDGATALHLCASHTSAAIAKMLIRKNADVNAKRKDGSSVLRDAVIGASPQVIKLLLAHGADINATCSCGNALLKCHSLNNHRNISRIGCRQWIEISDILERHVVKMRAADLYVSEKNIQALRQVSGKLSEFHKECKREIERMKSEKVTRTVSFYDVATSHPHRVAVLARFSSTVHLLQDITRGYTIAQAFPIYHDFIEQNFRRGQERERLLVPGVEAFDSLVGFALPDVITVDIFAYLSNEELENLAEADREALCGPESGVKRRRFDGRFDDGRFDGRFDDGRFDGPFEQPFASLEAARRVSDCSRCRSRAGPNLKDLLAATSRPAQSRRFLKLARNRRPRNCAIPNNALLFTPSRHLTSFFFFATLAALLLYERFLLTTRD